MLRSATVILLVVALCGCGSSAATTKHAPAGMQRADVAATRGLCGTRKAPRRWQHVVWIWLENHSYGQVLGPHVTSVGGASSFQASLGRACGVANGYYALAHPSLTDYVAAVSGGLQGLDSDCLPADCPLNVPTLFTEVRDSGRTWKTYAESMPGNCFGHLATQYTPAHNPAVYFRDLQDDCRRWDVPLGTTTDGALASDLRAGQLPAFALLVPNMCNNAHDCGIDSADAWLRTWVPKLTATHAYKRGTTAIFITWDEGAGGSAGQRCGRYTGSCHVATIVISPSTRRGTFTSTYYTHYSLLKTTEELLGLPYLGHARGRSTRSLRAKFGLR